MFASLRRGDRFLEQDLSCAQLRRCHLYLAKCMTLQAIYELTGLDLQRVFSSFLSLRVRAALFSETALLSLLGDRHCCVAWRPSLLCRTAPQRSPARRWPRAGFRVTDCRLSL